MVQVLPRNIRSRSKAASLTTVNTIYYTCPVGFSTQVNRIILSNGSNSNKTTTLQWYHKEDDTTHPIINAVVQIGNSVINYDFDLHMGAGDRIEASTEENSTVSLLISYHEEYIGT